MITKFDAIISLVPDAKIVVRGDEVEWISPEISPITDDQIVNEQDRLQTQYDAKDYQRKRALEYPDFKDYLDGVVKNDTVQIQAYINACNAIKAKYPK